MRVGGHRRHEFQAMPFDGVEYVLRLIAGVDDDCFLRVGVPDDVTVALDRPDDQMIEDLQNHSPDYRANC